MTTIRVGVLVLALAALGTIGATGSRVANEDWLGFQKQYHELSPSKGALTGELPPIELKQDRMLAFGEVRVDRCRSCHIAVDDPRFTADAHPLRTHPSIAPHTFNDLGCTVCHEGDGRATTKHLAHGEDHFWIEPLLNGQFIEASCARCHPYPYVAGMDHVRRGSELFERTGCMGCHKVAGLSRGTLGIELTDVGAKRSIKYLKTKLDNPLDPMFRIPSTIMPTFRILSEQDKADLVTYLKSLKARPIAVDPLTYRAALKKYDASSPPEVEPTAEAAQQAILGRGCVSCHKVESADGGLAPDLTFLGQIRTAEYVEAHLLDPRSHTPGSNMPNFWMSASERKAIANYLTSLNGFVLPAEMKDQYVQLCSRCHGEKGDGNGPVAANLLPRPRVFTNLKFFNWLPEKRAYDAIRHGVPGTAMPAFGNIIDDTAAQRLFAWVRTTFIGGAREAIPPRKIPAKNPVAYSAESVARGKATFANRCYGCHGRIGDGKGPNAPEMLPRPRNLTNHLFFEKLPDTRLFESITYGIVGTGMPPWDFLPDEQRWELVNFVRHLSSTGPAASERSK
jgi:mono/diheme cytochrome c family protein